MEKIIEDRIDKALSEKIHCRIRYYFEIGKMNHTRILTGYVIDNGNEVVVFKDKNNDEIMIKKSEIISIDLIGLRGNYNE